LQYICCKVKPWIQRKLSHTIKSRCACVWVYMGLIYMVANLILLYSFKTYLSFKTWKQLCKKHVGYLIHLFFSLLSGGHLSTHCFRYFGHLSIFFQFFFSFFMNNFCIATCLFSATKLLRDNKKLEHLFGVYPIGYIFGVYSQCKSKTYF
jgi:hypothetical protein